MSEPYRSIWVTDPVLELLEKTRGASIGLHQSAFDADSTRKAIRLGSNLPSIASLQKFGYLDPTRDRKRLIGKDPKTGKFRTSQAQVYRPGLCQAIAYTFEMHIADTPQTTVSEYNAGACREGRPPDFPLLLAGVMVEPIAPSGDIGDLICDWNWRTVFSHQVPNNSHINLKERRAVRLYLKRQAKSRTKKGRLIVLVDSQVARGALMRGRSSQGPSTDSFADCYLRCWEVSSIPRSSGFRPKLTQAMRLPECIPCGVGPKMPGAPRDSGVLVRARPLPSPDTAAEAATAPPLAAARTKSAPPTSRPTQSTRPELLHDWELLAPSNSARTARLPADIRREYVNTGTTGKRYEATPKSFGAWLWTLGLQFLASCLVPLKKLITYWWTNYKCATMQECRNQLQAR